MIEIFDNHKVTTYSDCEFKGWLGFEQGEGSSYNTGYTPKTSNTPLAFGLGMHKMNEDWSRDVMEGVNTDGKDYADSFRVDWERELPIEMRENLELMGDKHSVVNAVRLFQLYQRRFPPDLYEPVSVEQEFSLPLEENSKLKWSGILDKVVRHRGGLYFLEFKTSTYSIDEKFFLPFRTSQAIRGYTWAGQQSLGEDFRGTIVHGVCKRIPAKKPRTLTPDDYLGAEEITMLPSQLEEWRVNTIHKIDNIHRMRQDGYWIKDLGNACNLYNGCEFREVCGAAPESQQAMLDMGYKLSTWNPLGKGERRKDL